MTSMSNLISNSYLYILVIILLRVSIINMVIYLRSLESLEVMISSQGYNNRNDLILRIVYRTIKL